MVKLIIEINHLGTIEWNVELKGNGMISGGDFSDSSNAKPRSGPKRMLTFGGWRKMLYEDKLISYGNGNRNCGIMEPKKLKYCFS